MPHDGSYVWQLRQKVGHQKLIVPGVCAIITDDQGRVLLEHRRDFNVWGLPAGSCELGESVFQTLQREVGEETGLQVQEAKLMGLYTDPRLDVTYPNGDQIQLFAATFHVTRWSGHLAHDATESYGARWWPLNDLPQVHPDTAERLRDFLAWTDGVYVK